MVLSQQVALGLNCPHLQARTETALGTASLPAQHPLLTQKGQRLSRLVVRVPETACYLQNILQLLQDSMNFFLQKPFKLFFLQPWTDKTGITCVSLLRFHRLLCLAFFH